MNFRTIPLFAILISIAWSLINVSSAHAQVKDKVPSCTKIDKFYKNGKRSMTRYSFVAGCGREVKCSVYSHGKSRPNNTGYFNNSSIHHDRFYLICKGGKSSGSSNNSTSKKRKQKFIPLAQQTLSQCVSMMLDGGGMTNKQANCVCKTDLPYARKGQPTPAGAYDACW